MGDYRNDLRAARAKKYNADRVSALIELLPRLSASDRTAVVAEILATAREFENRFLQVDAFVSLLPYLTGSDADVVTIEARRRVRDIVDPSSRSMQFARLAPFLPEHERAYALIEAWAGSSSLDAEARGQALAEFLKQQEALTQEEVVQEALREVNRIGEPLAWFGAMKPLAKHLSKRQLESLAEGTRGITSIPKRVESLAKLGAELPESGREILLRHALLVADSTAEPEDRADALCLLYPFLPRPAGRGVLKEALEAIRSVKDAHTQADCFKRLSPILPPELFDQGLATLKTVRDKYQRMSTLVEFVPLLPETFQQRVIAMIMQEQDELLRIQTLVTLSRTLPNLFLSTLRDEIHASTDNERRAYALIQLADVSSKTERPSILASAVEVARKIPDALLRIRVLSGMGPYFRDTDQNTAFLSALRDEVQATTDNVTRSYALCHLADVSSETERPSILASAVEVARKIPDALLRIRVLIQIGGYFRDREQNLAFLEALSTAGSFEGSEALGKALIELARDVSSSHILSFVDFALSTTDRLVSDRLRATMRQLKEFYRPPPALAAMPSVDYYVSTYLSKEPSQRALSKEPSQQKRVVNTGFAGSADPSEVLDASTSLSKGEYYYFWMEVELPDKKSIEVSPTPLPTFTESVRLKVVVVPTAGEIVIDPAEAVGELELRPDGSSVVIAQPTSISKCRANPELLKKRLFFPIRPAQTGLLQFRSNIYYERILVQSRVITIRVTKQSRSCHQALRSVLDYSLSGTLNPSHLKQLTPHQMSLLLVTGEKTLSFSFFGAAGDEVVKREATFDVLELQDTIGQARGVLRRVAWGDEEDWKPTKKYRYGETIGFEEFQDDLISLALRGYRLYDSIIDRVMGSRGRSQSLENAMLAPGLIQIAIAESPRHHIPSTLFYDYSLETGVERSAYEICPGFLQALKHGGDLDDSDCFQGRCSSRKSHGKDRVICPSGFWGFRHEIGMPLSMASALDVPSEISYENTLQVAAGVSTDPSFILWEGHERVMRDLRERLDWTCATSRSDLFFILKESNPQLIYLYCHGGVANGIPYIQVGPLSEYVITRENFRNANFAWHESWPLVFINGCKTADLDPGRALELVSACVQCSASGVVGTEITLFEPLACAFAEEFMRRFFAGLSLGKSIRGARLALLKKCNPLGLVYNAYALASLRLVENRGVA